MGAFIDLTGHKIGRLSIQRVIRERGKRPSYICLCECGVEKIVSASHLNSKKTLSCGCLMVERIKEANFKHGETHTRLYRIWANMKSRCNCPSTTNYQLWGGKGVKVCDTWSKFLLFKDWALSNGYSKELSIDRINSDGDYTADNCRWVTSVVQNTNRSNTVFIEVNGEMNSLAEWARRTGIKYGTLSSWHKRGKSKDEISERIREVI